MRERPKDLPELAIALLQKIAKENAVPECILSPSALEVLSNYSFPGNVRELENILQRAATLCEDNLIAADNLEFMPVVNVLLGKDQSGQLSQGDVAHAA